MRSRVPVRRSAAAPFLKHAAAFSHREHLIVKVMESHRHENQINGVVWERYRFAAAKLVSNPAVTQLPPRLLQHLFGGINADNFGIEMSREGFGEASGAAAQIEDRVEALLSSTRRDEVHPEL